MSSSMLFPNVAGAPGSAPSRVNGDVKTPKAPAQAPDPKGAVSTAQNFSEILGGELNRPVTQPLKFSAHASSRLQSRKLDMGPEQMRKLNEAVDKAAAKGLDDTLVLTKDAAFIVSVSNRTVVTAMDREALNGNVFTNIDGAVIV